MEVEIEGAWIVGLLLLILVADGCDNHTRMQELAKGQNQALHGIWKELEKSNVGK